MLKQIGDTNIHALLHVYLLFCPNNMHGSSLGRIGRTIKVVHKSSGLPSGLVSHDFATKNNLWPPAVFWPLGYKFLSILQNNLLTCLPIEQKVYLGIALVVAIQGGIALLAS